MGLGLGVGVGIGVRVRGEACLAPKASSSEKCRQLLSEGDLISISLT